ncbi:proline-rich protein 22 [Eublepharis macularius]|uniref:Proline-rich protein 22 n=1 Tax=Eublepharis macularius TaxID=481883 RepID=A0AA97KYH6_EUBMA|nr:proline-rich protein 22 [Eublepharis macularius]
MQQPKLFYPDHETYTPRALDRPDNQLNRPFPAFILPDNLASVGTPNLYHPPNQEKDLFQTPPAGFHMAPCGCFFDPRIYRIEWATANFVQPSVYKLSGGPNPQSAYLLGSQKYLKGPIQPTPYQPYQPVVNNPPFALPFFKPEGPAPNLTEQICFISNPLHGSPFVEAPHLLHEGLGQSKDHTLQAMGSEVSLKERPAQTETCELQKEPLVDHSSDGTSTHHDLAFQDVKRFPEEGGESGDNDATSNFMENPPLPETNPESQCPVGMSSTEIMTESEPCVNLEAIVTNEIKLLEEQESFSLPDKVLLEDAMKLFDCSPVNSSTEDDPENGILSRNRGDSSTDRCFSGEDSSSDILSLNLPDELLSFDYSVPEILSTVMSLDYLYDVNAFGEDLPWESRASLHARQKHESHLEAEEKMKEGIAAAKKGRSVARKPPLASAQGNDGGPSKLGV